MVPWADERVWASLPANPIAGLGLHGQWGLNCRVPFLMDVASGLWLTENMSNQRRVLAEVLAIDAWHQPLRTNGGTSSVHVELSFRNGRIGGDDPEFPFTFRIALKRALLTVKLEPPLKLDRNSVARSIPVDQGEHTKTLSLRDEAKANASFSGKVSPSSLHASISGGASVHAEASQQDQLRVVQSIPRIIATPRPMGSHEYAWELVPGHNETLEGQPWNPVAEPRLSVHSVNSLGAIAPSIKIFVSCDLHDIEITDLKLKKNGPLDILKEAAFNRVNVAVAVQHLKLTLKEMTLEVGQLDDRFSELIVADLLSTEQ